VASVSPAFPCPSSLQKKPKHFQRSDVRVTLTVIPAPPKSRDSRRAPAPKKREPFVVLAEYTSPVLVYLTKREQLRHQGNASCFFWKDVRKFV